MTLGFRLIKLSEQTIEQENIKHINMKNKRDIFGFLIFHRVKKILIL